MIAINCVTMVAVPGCYVHGNGSVRGWAHCTADPFVMSDLANPHVTLSAPFLGARPAADLQLMVAPLETQIKSNIFNFWPKINLLNQSMHFLWGVRGVAWEKFHPYGVHCVCVNHFTPWLGGGVSPVLMCKNIKMALRFKF